MAEVVQADSCSNPMLGGDVGSDPIRFKGEGMRPCTSEGEAVDQLQELGPDAAREAAGFDPIPGSRSATRSLGSGILGSPPRDSLVSSGGGSMLVDVRVPSWYTSGGKTYYTVILAILLHSRESHHTGGCPLASCFLLRFSFPLLRTLAKSSP